MDERSSSQTVTSSALTASQELWPSSCRVVIFDFDGTLADTKESICTVARKVLLAHGLREEQLGDVARIVGPPFPQAFSMVYGVSADEAASITKDYRAIYNHLGAAAWPFFGGIRDLLSALKAAGKTCAVASSKRQELVERGVADNGASDLIDITCGRLGDSSATKASTISRVLRLCHTNPEEAVMVGDRCFDVEAARENGLDCIGVLYGHTADRTELENAGARAIVDDVEALSDLLLRSPNRPFAS